MASVKRPAYEADFKPKAISHAGQHGNRTAVREFSISESVRSRSLTVFLSNNAP